MKDSRQMLVLLVMVYIKLYYLVNTNPLKLWHASPIKKRRAKRSPTEQKCCMSKSFKIRGLSISECECGMLDGTANENRTREQFQLDVSLQENESSQHVLHLLVGRCTERGLEGRLFLLDVESIEYVNDLDDESCLRPSAEEISEQCTASVMKPHDCATDMSYKDHKQCSQLYMSDSRLGGIISDSDEYPSNLSSAENDDSSCAEVSAERTYVSTETTNCDCTAKNGYTEQQEYCEHCGAELRQDHLKPQSTDYLSVRSCGENEIPDGEVAANEETIRASCVTCEVGEWLESNVHKQDPKHHKGLHPHEKINNCAFPTNPVCPKSAAKVIESNCESLVRDIYPHKISNDMSEDKVSKAPLEVMTVPPLTLPDPFHRDVLVVV